MVEHYSRICCSYENGKLYVDSEGYSYLYSGTSFSAPQVSGAAALLAQAFPNLTGRQIADILLRSAFDVGAAGTDAIFGRGILDIAKAFQPIGTTSLAGSGEMVALGDVTGAGSPAMGDALATASLPAIVLDEYERAFSTDLAGTLRGAQVPDRLRQAVGSKERMVSFGSKHVSLAFSIDATDPSEPPRLGDLQLGIDEAETARVLAARVAADLAPGLKLGFAYAEGAHGLVAQLQGQAQAAFMVAPAASGDDRSVRRTDVLVALRRQLGPWGLTSAPTRGDPERPRSAAAECWPGSGGSHHGYCDRLGLNRLLLWEADFWAS